MVGPPDTPTKSQTITPTANLKFWDFQFEKLCVSLMSCFKTISLISRVDDLRQNMSEHPGGPRAIVKGYVREGKGKLEAGIAAEER